MNKEIFKGYLDRYCKPTALLALVQLFLVLCEGFDRKPVFVITLRLWMQSASFFLTIFNLLVIAYLFYRNKDNNQNSFVHHKLLNIGICILNIILVNELYKNSKLVELSSSIPKLLTEIWTSVFNFIEGRSFGGFLVLSIIVAAIVALAFASKQKVSSEQQIPQTMQPQAGQPQKEQPQKEQPQTTEPPTTPVRGTSLSSGSTVLFVFLYVLFLLLAIILVWYIVRHFDFITQIPENIDFLALLQFAVTGLALLIAVPVILMLIVRYMVAFFTNLPEYFSSRIPQMENMIKTAITCTVAMLLYFISNYSEIQWEDFIDFDSNKLLIILPPFVILVYAFVAYIIVELISGILSGKRPEFINKLKDAADRFGNNLIKYCDNIFRLLGTLLKVLPDFLTCLSILLFEEEETDNQSSPKSKSKDRNKPNTPLGDPIGNGDSKK